MTPNWTRRALALSLVIGLGACASSKTDRISQPLERQTSNSVKALAPPNEDVSPYPESWKVDTADVTTLASFPVYLPTHPDANISNSTASFVWPNNGAVAIDFPAPAEPASYVRQSYLEVYESPWDGSD